MFQSLLLSMSENRSLRQIAEGSRLGQRMASRFVAGNTLGDALRVARDLERQGIAVTLDALGESVTRPEEAHACAALCHQALDSIYAGGLRANLSLKLTQLGLDLDPSLTQDLLAGLLVHAEETNNFIRIDMEGSAYTEATLSLTERMHGCWPGRIGSVLQTYLYRTPDDAQRLLAQGIRIRLCKGAYREPASVAFSRKSDVDLVFTDLMYALATSGVFCAFATHDEAIIESMRDFVALTDLPKDRFEFQMLYGVRPDLQRSLTAEGYGVRVYLPFGQGWYPYFMRRLAERPANVLFLANSLLRS